MSKKVVTREALIKEIAELEALLMRATGDDLDTRIAVRILTQLLADRKALLASLSY